MRRYPRKYSTLLSFLDEGTIDGFVIAEAALIRLGLTHLTTGDFEGGGGQLAVIGKVEDHEMAELFSCIDVRKADRSFDLRVVHDRQNLVTPLFQMDLK